MTFKTTVRYLHLRPLATLCVLVALVGCKKSSSTAGDATNDDASNVTLTSADMANDGTISPIGLKKLNPSAPSLSVTFSRTRPADAALMQLAKFPNLKQIKAPSNTFQPATIEKLQAKIPGVEVNK